MCDDPLSRIAPFTANRTSAISAEPKRNPPQQLKKFTDRANVRAFGVLRRRTRQQRERSLRREQHFAHSLLPAKRGRSAVLGRLPYGSRATAIKPDASSLC